MTSPYVILSTRDVLDGRLVEVTVSTPDFGQATVTVTKSVAEGQLLGPTIEQMLLSRKRTLDELSPVEE